MRLLVWGLGRIGTVAAACLATSGHDVVGVEIDPVRRRAVAEGDPMFREPGLAERLRSALDAGRLTIVDDGAPHVGRAQASLVCAGSPPGSDGSFDLSAIRSIANAIGRGLSETGPAHIAVLRSTVAPGTARGPFSEAIAGAAGGARAGRFLVASYPDFSRETSAVADFDRPSVVVVGGEPEARERLRPILPAEPTAIEGTLEEAELAKLAANAFHALKIGFANEIARLAERAGADGRIVLETVKADRALNLSAAYLSPGAPFGGPCLGKDLEAFLAEARRRGEDVPLLEGLSRSNSRQIERAIECLPGRVGLRVGLLGFAFKPASDDGRGSPARALAAVLAREGAEVRVHDGGIHESALAEFRRILAFEPVLTRLASWAEALIVFHDTAEYRDVVETALSRTGGPVVLDLAGAVAEGRRRFGDRYRAIGW